MGDEVTQDFRPVFELFKGEVNWMYKVEYVNGREWIMLKLIGDGYKINKCT